MKHTLLLLTVMFTLLTSCGKQEQLKAKIFERREIKGNRLMIHYQYKVNEKAYLDSATISNVIIRNDSIRIIIDPSNPSKSIPDLTK
ncbi:MAG: hypothetical protein M3040_13415 [Bacteroidota bacterium]|nr:hypothetical protein [Bacteroidota bacterium]